MFRGRWNAGSAFFEFEFILILNTLPFYKKFILNMETDKIRLRRIHFKRTKMTYLQNKSIQVIKPLIKMTKISVKIILENESKIIYF